MNNLEKKELLLKGTKVLGLKLDEAQASSFMTYLEELKKWNSRINLTSIIDDQEIIVRHFLDSLILCRFIKPNQTLLDIGAGGGFPGLPIKIALGDNTAKLALMDSIEKKCIFMRHAIRTLGLKNTEAIWSRAEDLATIARLSCSFDIIVSRAFSELGLFLELATPYAKPAGRIIAVKGPLGPELGSEIDEVKKSSRLDSLTFISAEEFVVPLSDRRTTLIIYEKGRV